VVVTNDGFPKNDERSKATFFRVTSRYQHVALSPFEPVELWSTSQECREKAGDVGGRGPGLASPVAVVHVVHSLRVFT
jgi:hypothetical protein